MDPAIIKTDHGDELVILARADYEALLARANGPTEEEEDAGTARIIDRSAAAVATGRAVRVPEEFALALARGENALRVLRSWRGLTQAGLAERAGLDQGYVSALERGGRAGTLDTHRKLAAALGVPLDLLAGD